MRMLSTLLFYALQDKVYRLIGKKYKRVSLLCCKIHIKNLEEIKLMWYNIYK